MRDHPLWWHALWRAPRNFEGLPRVHRTGKRNRGYPISVLLKSRVYGDYVFLAAW